MKKIFLSIFLLLFMACASDSKKEQKISEEKVRKTFNDFFMRLIMITPKSKISLLTILLFMKLAENGLQMSF